MKTAERLAQKHFAVAIMRAAECAIAKDKNRALCMTKYTFDDNSVLAVREVSMCAWRRHRRRPRRVVRRHRRAMDDGRWFKY